MAIKGLKPEESVSIYDPNLKAYHELSIEDLRKQMESLGLTKEETDKKIKKLKGEK